MFIETGEQKRSVPVGYEAKVENQEHEKKCGQSAHRVDPILAERGKRRYNTHGTRFRSSMDRMRPSEGCDGSSTLPGST